MIERLVNFICSPYLLWLTFTKQNIKRTQADLESEIKEALMRDTAGNLNSNVYEEIVKIVNQAPTLQRELKIGDGLQEAHELILHALQYYKNKSQES